MGALFQFCYELTSIDLSSFDTSHVTEMDWMFNGCRNLKYANLGLLDASNLDTIKYMFWACNSLKYLKLYLYKIKTNAKKESALHFLQI